VLNVVQRCAPRPSRTLPVVVDERVRQDLEQPGPQVRSRPELVERPERPQVCLLDEILSVHGVPGHAVGGAIQSIDVAKRLFLELSTGDFRLLLIHGNGPSPSLIAPLRGAPSGWAGT